MSADRSIKINFRGASRDILLSTPATLVDLQAAVASSFQLDLPPRSTTSTSGGPGNGVSFTFKDAEGDDITFDTDHELNLALKVCPKTLEISASTTDEVPLETTRTTREVTDIYCVAAENLRERRGVTSMTNVKLAKTLPIFKFGPSRLVVRGLAPAHLLKPTTTPAPPDENDYDLCDGEGDIVDNEGFDETEIAHQQQVGTKPSNLPKRKTMHERIHAVLLGAGVEIRVKETRPLLKALGLLRCRLIGLGLIPRDNLRVNLQPGSALEEMFTVAARNLREHHGVPSMTPEMLVHTLAVLELRPSRLVGTGMAPKKYLRGGRKVAAADGGGKSSDNGEDESHNRLEPVASCDTDNQDHHREGPNAIHDAFVREGIKIQPPEAMALILALRVAPARLAKLGMVDPKQLRRFVRRFRRKGRQSGTRKHQNGSVCGDHVVPKRTSQK